MIDAIVLTMPPRRRLLSTGEAADALGIHRATLNRWKLDGYLKPTNVTLGGHARWDLDDLERQINEWRRRDEDAPDL